MGAVDEARAEDRMLIDLVEPEQTGTAAAPALASAATVPAPRAAVQTGAHSSSPSSEAMRDLEHGPRDSAVVHQDAQYEDVYADKDGMRALIDVMDANVNNELRVRGVNDLNEMHAINEIGTNDDFLNMENGMSDSLNGVPISNANVYVHVASTPSVRVSGKVQYVNERERVIVTQAVVHAVRPQPGAPVNRSISPFNPEPVASRAGAPATMSAVTCSTSMTSMARPFAARAGDDFQRMSTTAHSRLVIRDPNAAQPTLRYVAWTRRANIRDGRSTARLTRAVIQHARCYTRKLAARLPVPGRGVDPIAAFFSRAQG